MSQNELEKLFYEVDKYINEVSFEDIWPRFKKIKFALYDNENCFFDGNFIPKSDAFLANTSILFDGEMIAIWNVMNEEMNPKILASKIIHEMFHGFQQLNNELRFPDEIDALYNYEYNDENLSIKYEENKLLIDLYHNFDIKKFQLFLGLRKYRFQHFNYEFMYESKIEQIEGTANFVELYSLKIIDYNLYINKLTEMISIISEPQNLLPIRIGLYDSGALLLHILKENNIDFNVEFNNQTFLENLVLTSSICYCNDCFSMKSYIDSYYVKCQNLIHNTVVNGQLLLDKTLLL